MCMRGVGAQVKIAEGLPKERLDVTWKNGRHKATLRADLTDMSFEIIATRDGDDHEGDLHSFKCAPAAPVRPSLYVPLLRPRKLVCQHATHPRACRLCHPLPVTTLSLMTL